MLHPKPKRPPKRTGHRDPVSPSVHEAVLRRDGGCVAAILDPFHVCRDAWGMPHRWDSLRLLTVDHVKDEPRMGVRAPSDPAHLVAMCHGGNLWWAPTHRPDERAYLARILGPDGGRS